MQWEAFTGVQWSWEMWKIKLLAHTIGLFVIWLGWFSLLFFPLVPKLLPETQRKATQRDCLPRSNKMKKCAVRKIIFCTGLTRAAKAGQKNPFYPRKDPFSYVLQESPFISVSTDSRGQPSLVSLVITCTYEWTNMLANFPALSCFICAHAMLLTQHTHSSLCTLYTVYTLHTQFP